jgi:hypothetical protein
MANVTKKVDQNIYVTQRTQNFTQANASAGDIIKVYDSLGKPGRIVTIEAVGAMTVRFNVLRTIYPVRSPDALTLPNVTPEYPNLTAGVEIEDSTGALITIGAGETFTLDNDIPVYDIKIVSAAGNFDIFVA